MSPRTRFLARVRRRTSLAQRDVTAGYLKSLRALVDGLPPADVEQLLREPWTDAAIARLLSDESVARAFAAFRAQVQSKVSDGVMFFAHDIPRAPRATLSTTFGVLNPRVVTAIRSVDGAVMARLATEVRDSVREVLVAAARDGTGPRGAARLLRAFVGLGPSEQQQIANFRAALLGEGGRNWRDYARRDRRFDRLVERAQAGGGLRPDQVDRIVGAYTTRRQALAAENTSRTATLTAYKQAQRTAWDVAIEQGFADPGNLMKEWIGVNDSRERPEHVAMNGTVVPYDEPFPNGQMIPGEFDYNCRCWSRVFAGRGR